jgi:hypothetical protein
MEIDYEYEEYRSTRAKIDFISPEDLNSLIDLALDTRDFAWVRILVRKKERMISKIEQMKKIYKKNNALKFYCPGCDTVHVISLDYWYWNENFERPTIRPSIMQTYQDVSYCHLKLKNGKIEYMKECWHGLEGQIIDLVKFKEET